MLRTNALHLASADVGSKSQTTTGALHTLSSDDSQPVPPIVDWAPDLAPGPPALNNRHTDVSADLHTSSSYLFHDSPDHECSSAPSYIPEWVLPQEDLNVLREAGEGAAPDLIYVRGIPPDIDPFTTQFDRKDCNIIIVELGFCRDLGLPDKLLEKHTKYQPLSSALLQYWGHVDVVCIPVGHAGTTLSRTVDDLANALARVRPSIADSRRLAGHADPDHDARALKHDRKLFRRLMDSLCNLAQDRLLGIINNRRKEVAALNSANCRPPFPPHHIATRHLNGPIK